MKVAVHINGGWSDGLDSNVRGEGRWCFNIAKMLSVYGHDVYVSCGGEPAWGSGERYNCKLLSDRDIRQFEPYDLYISDYSQYGWFGNFSPPCRSKFYAHIHWDVQEHLKSKLPSNFLVLYPYKGKSSLFHSEENKNCDKTFLLPAPFCHRFSEPNTQARKIFLPGRALVVDDSRFGCVCKAVLERISKYICEGSSSGVFSPLSGDLINNCSGYIDFEHSKSQFCLGVPYNKIMEEMRQCRVNFPVEGPSCIIDAAVFGAATPVWDRVSFFCDAAKANNICLPHQACPEAVQDVMDRLMYDDVLFCRYVRDLQDELSDHTYEASYSYFQSIARSL